MNHTSQIFQTQTKKRWTRVKWTSRIIGIVTVFLLFVTVLAVINATNPSLPEMNDRAKVYKAILNPNNKFSLSSVQNKKYKGFKYFLEKKQIEDSVKRLTVSQNKTSLIRSAFSTPWNKASLPDLIKNADKLNTVYPEWFFIDTITFKLQTRIDSAGLAIIKKNNLSIQPIFNNFHTGKTANERGFFDSKLLHVILSDTTRRNNIIGQISDTLIYYHLQGLNVDFEEINEKSNDPLTKFQQQLFGVLHSRNLLVSMDVQAKNEDYDFKELSKYNDYVILMAYDEFNDATEAGPISSQKWIEEQLDWMDDKIDVSKIILGVAGYARDWITEGEGKRVEDITYAAAIDNAKLSRSAVTFDNSSYNLHYSYSEPKSDTSSETKHTIWLTDAATTFNILRFSDDNKTAGTALWHLGGEDPRIWKYYGRDLSTAALQKTPFNFNTLAVIPIDPFSKPTATGEGELLNILYTPVVGKIKIELDTTGILIAEQQYIQLPSGYVYEKFAEDKTQMGPGHKIILTFDDGPDPEYTPKILTILEKEKIPPATSTKVKMR